MESSFDKNTIPLVDASQIRRGESNEEHSKSSSSQQGFNGQRMSSDTISQSKQTKKREHSEESDDEIFPCKGCDEKTLKQNTILGLLLKQGKQQIVKQNLTQK